MSVILWNRTAQNAVLSASGKPLMFFDATAATAALADDPVSHAPGLQSRLTEEARRAGLPVPVIDQVTVL